MCGRYELHSHPAAIALAFGLASPPDVHARYNIAPMTEVPIVRVNAEGQRELVRMRWGLVPRWAKDPSIGARMINARGETIAEKPSFRMSFRRHRCLLPADGFYEWRAPPPTGAGEAARKQPLHIGMADGSLFGLAGTLRALDERGRRRARHLHDRDDGRQRAGRPDPRPDAVDRRPASSTRAGSIRPMPTSATSSCPTLRRRWRTTRCPSG